VERRLVGRCSHVRASVLLWFAFGWAGVPSGLPPWGLLFGAGMERVVVRGRLGTLLGPEGTGASRVGCVCFFCGPLPRSNRPLGCLGCLLVRWLGVRVRGG
jgi:hypothetical protein